MIQPYLVRTVNFGHGVHPRFWLSQKRWRVVGVVDGRVEIGKTAWTQRGAWVKWNNRR